jgi:hypothetical protein
MDRQMHIFDYTLEDTFTLDPNNRWAKNEDHTVENGGKKYAHMFRGMLKIARSGLRYSAKGTCSQVLCVFAL